MIHLIQFADLWDLRTLANKHNFHRSVRSSAKEHSLFLILKTVIITRLEIFTKM